MKAFQYSLRILFTCCLLIFSHLAASATLVYEREYSSFVSGDNTLRMTLDERGVFTVVRPSFMTNPGRHVFQVSPQRYIELSVRLAELPFTSEELNATVIQRVKEEMFYVSHPEYTRFQLLDSARKISDTIEIVSLRAYSSQFKDNADLSAARVLEEQWLSMMGNLIETKTENSERVR